MSIQIITIFLVTIILLYKFIKWLHNILKFIKIVNKFPGFKSKFFFADILKFSSQLDVLFLQISGYFKEFSTGFRAWNGLYMSYFFNKADDFENVLSSHQNNIKGGFYKFFVCWLGEGLLTSEGEKWKRRRKLLTPAFHFNILKKFVTIFEEHNEIFINKLAQECKKDKTNVIPIVSKLTLDIICDTAMGIKLNENIANHIQYRKAIDELGKLLIYRVINIHHYFNWFYFNFTPSGWQFKKYLKIAYEFTSTVIKERERNFKDSDVENLETDDEDFVYSKKRITMLDLLISAKRNTGEIDDVGIQEEVETFMLGGHDTTAMAISFLLLLLANNKDIQEKVRLEIDEIFQGSNKAAKYSDLQSMVYLDQVIKESLRLYPSVPVISRSLVQNVPIRNGKYVMPKEAYLLMFIYHLHRDAEVFPDPEKFDPDRFRPENSRNRHPYAYVPFSAGRRNCIGQKYAIFEMKSIICSILRHYEIDPVDKREDLVMIIDILLRTKNGIHVKFKPRKKYMN